MSADLKLFVVFENICGINASCSNTYGSYVCACRENFESLANCESDSRMRVDLDGWICSKVKDDSSEGYESLLDLEPLLMTFAGVLLIIVGVILIVVFVREQNEWEKQQQGQGQVNVEGKPEIARKHTENLDARVSAQLETGSYDDEYEYVSRPRTNDASGLPLPRMRGGCGNDGYLDPQCHDRDSDGDARPDSQQDMQRAS